MNDKLREALEMIAKTGPDARQCRNIAVAALAASKQEPKACHKRSNEYCNCERNAMLCDGVGQTSKQEPQAQAEPEVVAYRNPTGLYSIIGKYEKENNIFQYTDDFLEAHNEELITLQSHREAMAPLQNEMNAARLYLREKDGLLRTIAKKDAALDACVEALEAYEALIGSGLYKEAVARAAAVMKSNAAITQAKEARQ